MPKKGESTPIVDRVMRKVKMLPNGCWQFTGSTPNGYGFVSSDKPRESPKLTHVVMWVSKNGPIPLQTPPLCVLHKCDFKPCCNPQHLFLGTRKTNNDDMIQKGRAKLSHKGETNPGAKLTETIVRFIRKSRLSGAELSRRYSVTKTMISYIRKGKAWSHVK